MDFKDILYEKKNGIARITINRQEKMNSFRTQTLLEAAEAFENISLDRSIGVAVLRGAGDRAFCTGGDTGEEEGAGYGHEMMFYVRRVHELIRRTPVPVIAAVNGYAIGGGQVLQVLCDLSIAADHAVFGQVGPRVGSFDAGYGAAYLARVVGEKKAREMWFLCEKYTALEAKEMGLINKIVPKASLDEEVDIWCNKILALSPSALRILKASFNRESDHIAGSEAMAFDMAHLYYKTEEANEAMHAYREKRTPAFDRFRK
ncbi:MAG: enoyl-CoA hydratase-related protein [Syntrophales bacterium]|jgi:naphthoate synthase|nr:enoyl-CoA hydratase-related protein [Syntrophales bacterium]MDY0043833.1 enoyl-CoA hydratase-related protein [Syntrophales bacterium]